MKKLLIMSLVIVSSFMFINDFKAEEFTNPNDLEWWAYKDNNTQLASGRGYIDELFFGKNGVNRVQWLFKDYYTYYPGWFYDVSFTVDTTGNYELPNFIEYINKCSIGVGDGKEYKCNLVKNGSKFTISVSNISVSNNTNTLWLNIYSDKNVSVQFITSHYSLNIYNKEDKTVTSDILMNTVNSMINNQIQNTLDIMNNQNKNQQQTNEKLDNINNSITDDTPPDTSEFGDVAGWLPSGPVDSIITLPLNALNSISNSLNGNCSTINLPLPFIDSTLPLTCGTDFYSQVSGLSLFLNSLFTILGGITLYKYFVYLYNWVDRIVSLKEDDEKWGAV